jgi:hypothetical protein
LILLALLLVPSCFSIAIDIEASISKRFRLLINNSEEPSSTSVVREAPAEWRSGSYGLCNPNALP